MKEIRSFICLLVIFCIFINLTKLEKCVCTYDDAENLVTHYKNDLTFNIDAISNPIVDNRILKRSEIDIIRDFHAKRMLSYMDFSIDPCTDFYQYACGNYFENLTIKSGYHSVDTWLLVEYEIDKRLHGILQNHKFHSSSSAETKIQNFYKSCLKETDSIFNYPSNEHYMNLIMDIFGGWPAKNFTQWYNNFKMNHYKIDWFDVIIKLKLLDIDCILYENLNNDKMLIDISAKYYSLIPMNSLDYELPYTNDYKINKKLSLFIMKQYNVSDENANVAFNEIMEFSKFGTNLYEGFENDTSNKYDNITINELIYDILPEITEYNWNRYFKTLFSYNLHEYQLKRNENAIRINIDDVEYFRLLAKFLNNTKPHILVNFFVLKLLYGLHDEYQSPKYLNDHCLSQLKTYLHPILDSIYYHSEYRNKDVEHEVLILSMYMKNSLIDVIKNSKWLDKSSKSEAIRKIKLLYVNLDDYDDTLNTNSINLRYKKLKLTNLTTYHENMLIIRKFFTLKQHENYLLNDPDDNLYTTIDVNAYYDENKNLILLPTGILHEPLYVKELPKSYNYGIMGGKILGHEIMHSFDSDCIKFNARGIEDNWLTESALIIYANYSQCLIDQYNSYKIFELNEYVNGLNTLGENLSDNGGIKLAYYGYKKWLKTNINSIDLNKEQLHEFRRRNITNMQLFFISYGQGLCSQYKRKGYKRILNDVHTIEKFRTIGSLRNFPEFSKEFQCKLGTPMNPIKKCELW